MTQWGLTDDANNAVKWAAQALRMGSGKAARAANNTALYGNVTPFTDTHHGPQAVGVFAVSPAEIANGSGEAAKVTAPGWHLRRVGQGGITGFSVAAGADGGSFFSNGDTFTVTNGSVDATGVVIANSTYHMTGASIVTPGAFPNTDVLEFVFNREQHLSGVAAVGGRDYSNTDYVVVSNAIANGRATFTIDANGTPELATITQLGQFANDTANDDLVVTVYAANGARSNAEVNHLVSITVDAGSGYDNTDYIVVSNATVNARATFVTNSTGGFGNTDITITQKGIFDDAAVDADVVITVLAANGAASNGADAVLTANIAFTNAAWTAEIDPSTGGVITATLGGRAGRVTYECLVASRHIANGDTDDAYLPE